MLAEWARHNATAGESMGTSRSTRLKAVVQLVKLQCRAIALQIGGCPGSGACAGAPMPDQSKPQRLAKHSRAQRFLNRAATRNKAARELRQMGCAFQRCIQQELLAGRALSEVRRLAAGRIEARLNVFSNG